MALRDQLRVMIVDDMSTSRGLISQALEGFGLQKIQTADNGADALKQLQLKKVHLVLSDYNMPGMDGLQLLAMLRKTPQTQKLGFILITGQADPVLIQRGKSLGMNNYLAKPFTPVDLKNCLEAVVGRL